MIGIGSGAKKGDRDIPSLTHLYGGQMAVRSQGTRGLGAQPDSLLAVPGCIDVLQSTQLVCVTALLFFLL